MFTFSRTDGMGNIFGAALRRARYAISVNSDDKAKLEAAIRNLPGMQNYFFQVQNGVDALQRRIGQTDTVVQLRERLNRYRSLLSEFDDIVREAVAAAREDGQTIVTQESRESQLGVWPVIVIASIVGVAIVALYVGITSYGIVRTRAIELPYELEADKARIDALVASGNAPLIPTLPTGGGSPRTTGGQRNTGNLFNLDMGDMGMPLLLAAGVGAFLLFRRKRR